MTQANDLTVEERVCVLDRLLVLAQEYATEWEFGGGMVRIPARNLSFAVSEADGGHCVIMYSPASLPVFFSRDADARIAERTRQLFDAFHDIRHRHGNHPMVKLLKEKLGVDFSSAHKPALPAPEDSDLTALRPGTERSNRTVEALKRVMIPD